ncbi:MAG: DUF4166 domain-containing protein [Phycisphaeraceae bacterium]|nr:DUF4166 domain-containing protein [Phycisphaeraceae bacterium]
MTSIYQIAMGKEFDRLHPMIQKRFGFSAADGVASIGRGKMDRIWRGAFYTLPFLYVGTWRRIMFPDNGRDIPFTIRNYAYADSFGRETVTWIRNFDIGPGRRFDATMIYSEKRRKIVDYLGTHQHLAVDLDLSADTDGGIRIRSGEQRLYESLIGFRFPCFFSGVADVREWFDDAKGKFGIEVVVNNSVWGPLFGYNGWFDAEWINCKPGEVPSDVKPLREERRE